MTFLEGAEFFARFIWPVGLAWNVYLYRVQQKNREEMYSFRLHVAENYTGKKDLEKMFEAFEGRINSRLDRLDKEIRK